MSDDTEPRTLYHYTSFSALQGILNSRELWATDIRFLNDSTEFSYAQTLLRQAIDESLSSASYELEREALVLIRETFAERMRVAAYVFSMSGVSADDLSQWRGYADGSGVAIGFRVSLLRLAADSAGFSLVKCTYDQEIHKDEIRSFLRTSVSATLQAGQASSASANLRAIFHTSVLDRVAPEFLKLATKMKDSGFSAEAEWRLVGVRTSTPSDIRVRAGRSILVPFTTIPIFEKRDPTIAADRFPILLIIDHILTGPNVHSSDLLFHSISSAYLAAGFGWRHITNSAIPYRPVV